MAPGATGTGAVLEAMVLPALKLGGYSCELQAKVGIRPGGRKHKLDVLATRGDDTIMISLKWQQTRGTAEQKVPFEVMCLADAVRGGAATRAYLVLGGDGWTLRDYFTSGALREHLVHSAHVQVITLEKFVALANGGKL
jgi:hypothetical protein